MTSNFHLRFSIVFATCVGLALTTFVHTVAFARKPQALVAPFTGSHADDAYDAYVGAIRKRVSLISSSEAGSLSRSAETIVATCQRVQCDVVVFGETSRKKRFIHLKVSVYDGGTGRLIGTKSAKVRLGRPIKKIAAGLGRSTSGYLARGRASKSDAAVASSTETSAAESATTPVLGEEENPLGDDAKPVHAATAKTSDDEDKDDDEGDSSKKKRSKFSGLFNGTIGMAFTQRSYSLTPKQGTAAPSEYKGGGFYPEIVVELNLYPLVLFDLKALRTLGIGVSFSRPISISTELSGTSVNTSAMSLGFDLHYRYLLSAKATSPSFVGFFGFGLNEFALQPNPILATFSYQFFRFGLGARVPILTPLFALEGMFELHPVLSPGQEAVDTYGKSGGGFGIGFRGGISGEMSFGVTYFAGVELLTFGSSFDGLDPAQFTPRPGYSDRFEPTSGSDTYLRILTGVGYVWR